MEKQPSFNQQMGAGCLTIIGYGIPLSLIIGGISDGSAGLIVLGLLLLAGAILVTRSKLRVSAERMARQTAEQMLVDQNRSNARAQCEQALGGLQDFSPSASVLEEPSGARLIALDHGRRTLCLIELKADGRVRTKIIPASEVLDAAIVANGSTVTTTQKTGAIGNAIAGGIIAGGAGAVVGATQAKATSLSSTVYDSICLRITIADLDAPIFDFVFYRGVPLPETEGPVASALRDVGTWHGRLRALMHIGSGELPVEATQQATLGTPKNSLQISHRARSVITQESGPTGIDRAVEPLRRAFIEQEVRKGMSLVEAEKMAEELYR
jgi:hypothetical protein